MTKTAEPKPRNLTQLLSETTKAIDIEDAIDDAFAEVDLSEAIAENAAETAVEDKAGELRRITIKAAKDDIARTEKAIKENEAKVAKNERTIRQLIEENRGIRRQIVGFQDNIASWNLLLLGHGEK